MVSEMTQGLKYHECVWENNLPAMLLCPQNDFSPPSLCSSVTGRQQEPLVEIGLVQ